jgi:hypothetical protein
MIRYRYAQEMSPPAPFVNVTLRCPATRTQMVGLPAQIDIAADRTVLPERVVDELGLVEDGRALFQGFEGQVIELPVFLIEVQVRDFSLLLARAALGANERHILLGRDVLNAHRVLLNGPQLILEIERPSAS